MALSASIIGKPCACFPPELKTFVSSLKFINMKIKFINGI